MHAARAAEGASRVCALLSCRRVNTKGTLFELLWLQKGGFNKKEPGIKPLNIPTKTRRNLSRRILSYLPIYYGFGAVEKMSKAKHTAVESLLFSLLLDMPFLAHTKGRFGDSAPTSLTEWLRNCDFWVLHGILLIKICLLSFSTGMLHPTLFYIIE